VIGRTREQAVNFHLVPNTLEVIIGKGSVDSLNELPLVQITYEIEKSTNRTLKRFFDVVVSFLLLISIYPFVYFRRIAPGTSRSQFILRLPAVLSGKRSLVGPPETFQQVIERTTHDSTSSPGHGGALYLGKPGLTGLIQLQRNRTLSEQEREQYNLYYAKNQSLALDVEILLKAMLQSRHQA
jgi:lipopolysaccharide/colanic/teichoic acid biosynthesis glycosyltransferase